MVHDQRFSLKEIKVFEQILVLLEEMKGLNTKLQVDCMIFKQNLKDSFEEVDDEEVEPQI